MIRMLLAATLIAGGTTIAIAQGAGGGTGTVTRDDNRPAASASGQVVCNGNVCWRTTERYDYPADSGVIIREPGWTPGPGITFRERTGRGYWRDDTWVEW
jgi:hypothetical protein